MPSVLLIDDEPVIQHAFRRALRSAELHILVAGRADEALAIIADERPDVVVLDVHLPDASGLEAFRRIRALDARMPVILITGHGTTDLAIEAMKEGAFDFLLKPLELDTVLELVQQAVRSSQLMRTPATMPEVEAVPIAGDHLLGKCPAMQEVYKSIGRVARQDVTALILGESGTGKELVARAIYQHSQRGDKPFVAINCGAIPASLIESELFGHEKGAFTGAERRRIGKFEQANGGTIFLDEVGELPLLLQVKLLRLLQEQSFERVGGNETVTVNVRIIAATNDDLEASVDAGRFRKDLFFRLNVFTIELPALRDRGDDVCLLIEHYIRRYAAEFSKPVEAIAPETMAKLIAYPWPGNVRELQSVLKKSLLQMRGAILMPDDVTLPRTSVAPVTGFDWDSFVAARIAAGNETVYEDSLSVMEREVLVRVLRHTEGNQLHAAKILGISRGNLRAKIKSLGISIERGVWSEDGHADLE